MSKESFYFPHDYDPTGDPKMQALLGEFGGTGYGVFWRVIEMMHSDSEHKLPLKQYIYLAIAKQMLTNAEQIQAIINYCINPCELFISDDAFFWSNRVNDNFNKRAQISEVRSVAGKAGAIAKQKLANTSKEKKKKEKKNKEENKSIEFFIFWEAYHTLTKLCKSDKEATEKYWQKLELSEQQKAIDNVKPYYDSLNDKKYCKKARTYLSDKNFNDEFIKLPIIKKKELDPRYDLIPDENWVEPQRQSNAQHN